MSACHWCGPVTGWASEGKKNGHMMVAEVSRGYNLLKRRSQRRKSFLHIISAID